MWTRTTTTHDSRTIDSLHSCGCRTLIVVFVAVVHLHDSKEPYTNKKNHYTNKKNVTRLLYECRTNAVRQIFNGFFPRSLATSRPKIVEPLIFDEKSPHSRVRPGTNRTPRFCARITPTTLPRFTERRRDGQNLNFCAESCCLSSRSCSIVLCVIPALV